MKKKFAPFLLLLLSMGVYASPKKTPIELTVIQGESQQSHFEMPLDRLQVNVLYQITCDIVTAEKSGIKILFEPRLLASSSYGNVELNEVPIPNNSDNLKFGKNRLTFRLLISKKDVENYNRFALNSSSELPFQIPTCTAREEIPPVTRVKSILTSNADGGYFFAINNTDRAVVVGVGNFFPTEYVINPHDWRAVFVSTDNQNIHIQRIL
jgi:hypothetical protein